MKKILFFALAAVLFMLPVAMIAQTVTAPPFDLTTPAAAFNTIFYIVMGLISVVVGQFSKSIPFLSGISTTAIKVTSAIIPVAFLIIHFGTGANVLSSIYAAIISLFVGAGMYSLTPSSKD